jgi:DNA-binding transcriptional ArsR family regulator
MKTMITIRDPAAFQLVADETRRKIIYLLRAKELTVGQISTELNLTPQAVYHHIKKLQDGGMVEVVKEERVGHLIESYYRATAEVFSFSMGKTATGIRAAHDQVVTALSSLKRLGFKVDLDEKKISKLVDVLVEHEKCCETENLEEKISKLEDIDFITQQTVREYAETLMMSDEEYAKRLELKRKFRDMLKSLAKK